MIRRLLNFPYWLFTVLPTRYVLDRIEGWVRIRPHGKRLWIHEYSSCPSLVVQGKSADWASELEAIKNSPFFRYYTPKAHEVVVSVGAGIGTEAFIASEMVGEIGCVLAIEGDPTAFTQLVLGIQSNRYGNVLPFNGLVAESPGWGKFFLGDESGKDFTTSSMFGNTTNGVKLPTFTLDQILSFSQIRHVDLLLMNIEGAELRALSGLSVLPKRMVISCHDFLGDDVRSTYDDVNNWLVDRGYKVLKFDEVPERPWESFYIFGELSERG